jgi:predicted site-specific integrase-resolvase
LHPNTLRKYADNGTIKSIKTPGGKRQLDLSSFIPQEQPKGCSTICYARVSTLNQKEQLQTQKQCLSIKYPNAEIISDIGSGLNLSRKGLNSILERALSGENITLVCTHKDRLARFGIELIEKIIEKSGGKILVLNKVETSPTEELTRDLISIITGFSSRIYGLRSHQNKKILLEAIKGAENTTQTMDGELPLGVQQNSGDNGEKLP